MRKKKRCSVCKNSKNLSQFSKNRAATDNLQANCKACQAAHYRQNREYRRKQHKQYRERNRQEVLEYYGARCACCSENKKQFLALDHINGGGSKHKKKVAGSMYLWARKHNMPSIFRILCHNCNMAKGIYGYCPHEKETNI